jgi:hypothetical protein
MHRQSSAKKAKTQHQIFRTNSMPLYLSSQDESSSSISETRPPTQANGSPSEQLTRQQSFSFRTFTQTNEITQDSLGLNRSLMESSGVETFLPSHSFEHDRLHSSPSFQTQRETIIGGVDQADRQLEDYYVRSMRLSVYLTLLPVFIQYYKEKKMGLNAIIENIRSILQKLSFIKFEHDLQTQFTDLLSSHLSSRDIGKLIKSTYYSDMNFLHKKTSQDTPTQYFFLIDWSVYNYIELELEQVVTTTLSCLANDTDSLSKISSKDANILETFCRTGKLAIEQSETPSELIKQFRKEIVNTIINHEDNNSSAHHKNCFKQSIMSRSPELKDLLIALYQSLENQREQTVNGIKKHYQEKQNQFEDTCDSQKTLVQKKTQIVLKQLVMKGATTEIEINKNSILTSAQWECRIQKDRHLGLETVLNFTLGLKESNQFHLNLVIDGSGSMGIYTDDLWGITLMAVQELLKKTLSTYGPNSTKLSVVLFGLRAKVIYNKDNITQELIQQFAEQMSHSRDRTITDGTSYSEAMKKLINHNITGPILFYTDGKPSHSDRPRILNYTQPKKDGEPSLLDSKHIQILPVFVSKNQNTVLKGNTEILQSLTKKEFNVLVVTPNSIPLLFDKIIKYRCIQSSFTPYTYSLTALISEKSTPPIHTGTAYCNAESNEIKIPLKPQEAGKGYLLEFQRKEGAEAYTFGVDTRSTIPLYKEWDKQHKEQKQMRQSLNNERRQEIQKNQFEYLTGATNIPSTLTRHNAEHFLTGLRSTFFANTAPHNDLQPSTRSDSQSLSLNDVRFSLALNSPEPEITSSMSRSVSVVNEADWLHLSQQF